MAAGDIVTVGGTGVLSETLVWDDVRVSMTMAKATVASPSNMDYSEYNATSGAYSWHFNDTDGATPGGLSFEIQIPHGYKAGTDIRPHLHWGRITAGTGNVGWQVGFTIIKNDGTAAAHIAKATATETAIPDVNDAKITSFPVISGTTYSLVESDIILCWLKRDNTIGTNYAGDAWIFSFDYHIQIEKPGTLNYAPPFM